MRFNGNDQFKYFLKNIEIKLTFLKTTILNWILILNVGTNKIIIHIIINIIIILIILIILIVIMILIILTSLYFPIWNIKINI